MNSASLVTLIASILVGFITIAGTITTAIISRRDKRLREEDRKNLKAEREKLEAEEEEISAKAANIVISTLRKELRDSYEDNERRKKTIKDQDDQIENLSKTVRRQSNRIDNLEGWCKIAKDRFERLDVTDMPPVPHNGTQQGD